MNRPSEYYLVGPDVLDYVDRFAPDHVYEHFYDLIEALVLGPYPDDDPSLGIMPFQDPDRPNSFTAPFGYGCMLHYQVKRDQPVIKLIDAFWIDDTDDEDTGLGFAF